MKSLTALIKREYLEHRGAFLGHVLVAGRAVSGFRLKRSSFARAVLVDGSLSRAPSWQIPIATPGA